MIFFDKDEPHSTPLRSDIALEDTWNLALLYPTDSDWEAAFEKLRAEFQSIETYRGRVGESAETLLALLETEKTLDLQIERLGHYSMLRASEDSSDNVNLSRRARLQNLWTQIGESAAFVVPELVAIPDETWVAFLSAEKLTPWLSRLERIRRMKPHTLSSSEERLMALAGSALHGHSETFSQLTNVDMKFGTLRDAKGGERPLTQSSFSSFLISPDPQVRKTAFHQFYAEFTDHQFTVASTLASSVRSDVFDAKARNYPSALEASLFHDAIPVAVYDNLISTVREYLAPLHDYYDLRREKLGLAELHAYDTYVPLISEFESNVSFDAAIDQVIAALAPLGSEYCDTLATGLRQRWCDRYESQGKRSGAFSSSSYGNPPFILMNYKADVFSDVYTLAHEAGHSMHTWFSQKTQPYQDYNYPIFLAEVASTFNENLLTHHLLATTSDRQMRAYLINRQIDDLRGTLFRQTMFAEFEKTIHALEESGEALTLDTFKAVYQELLTAYFGPRVVLDNELQLECLRIPHFYNAFYVYKYATGLSAATALADRVLTGGAAELESYLGFLKSGGSKYPLETLQAAGVDMSTPVPIRASLELFQRRVTELRELLS
ncbi:MAG: oligoendopeptidase F [Chthoniobacterales bacterium]